MTDRSGGTPPTEPPRARFSDAWQHLTAEIEACRRCPLGSTRTHAVIYRGAPRPTVVFLGEAPGASEDATGVPFVGRAGRRLDSAIESAGLGPSEFGVLNLFKCRPRDNRFDRAAAEACRPFLDRQVAELDPQLVVTLGAHALEALRPGSDRIGVLAGRPLEGRTPVLFPLLHPAAPMHNPNLRARWNEDIEKLARYLTVVRAIV